MRQARSDVSERRACQVLHVARATVRAQPRLRRRSPVIAESLAAHIHALIQQHLTFGYRQIWARLRFDQGAGHTRGRLWR